MRTCQDEGVRLRYDLLAAQALARDLVRGMRQDIQDARLGRHRVAVVLARIAFALP